MDELKRGARNPDLVACEQKRLRPACALAQSD